MSDASDKPRFDQVKERLDQIVDEVRAEGVSLDDALALYEEAVKLGLEALDLSEVDVLIAAETEKENESAPDDQEAPHE